MMQERSVSKKLSKAVLELKFMKKSKEKAIVQEENEERQQLYQDQLSSLHEGADKIVIVNSYVDCLKFLPCRLSFGGMDPDIEKLNEDKLTGIYRVVKPSPSQEAVTEMNADVTAKEMAEHYRPKAHKREHLEEEDDTNTEVDKNVEASEPKQGDRPLKDRPTHQVGDKRGNARRQDKNHSRYYGGKKGDFRGGDRGNFRGGNRGNFRGGNRGNFRGGNRGNFRGGNRGNFKKVPKEEFQGKRSSSQDHYGSEIGRHKKMKPSP